jgi:hypothetical protein
VADQWSGSLPFCFDDMVVFRALPDAFTQVKPEPLSSSDSSSCYSYDGFGLPELEQAEPMMPSASSDVAETPKRDEGGRGGRGEGQALPGVRLRPWSKFAAEVADQRAGEGRRLPAEGPMGREEEEGGEPGKAGGRWRGKRKKVRE